MYREAGLSDFHVPQEHLFVYLKPMVPYKNPLYTVCLKTMAKPDLTFLQCVRVALIFLRGRYLPLSHISRKYQLTLLYIRLACLVNTENEMVC